MPWRAFWKASESELKGHILLGVLTSRPHRVRCTLVFNHCYLEI